MKSYEFWWGGDDWINIDNSDLVDSSLNLTKKLTIITKINSNKEGTSNLNIIWKDNWIDLRQYNIHLTYTWWLIFARTFLSGSELWRPYWSKIINSSWNEWYTLWWTWDKDINWWEIKLYVDSIVDAIWEYNIELIWYNQLVQIWTRSWWWLNSYFKWKIDEVRIYNRALSDSEIKELYYATK